MINDAKYCVYVNIICNLIIFCLVYSPLSSKEKSIKIIFRKEIKSWFNHGLIIYTFILRGREGLDQCPSVPCSDFLNSTGKGKLNLKKPDNYVRSKWLPKRLKNQ